MIWTDPAYNAVLIRSLDDSRFAALCNSLLSETAGQHGLRVCLALNLRVTEPDGGIDARCVNSPKTIGRLIPRLFVDYQFRSGSTKKSPDKLIEEDVLAKPRVLEGLKKGHAFVYLAGWDSGDKFEEKLVEGFRRRMPQISIDDDQILFTGRTAIAHLLQAFPGLISRWIGIDVPLADLDKWAQFPHLRNEFQIDAAVQQQLDDLKARIELPGSRTRVTGAAGDGKTRLTLESLKRSSLADSVLYASEAEKITPSFVTHLERTPDIHCTLIVDETDERAAQRLNQEFSCMPLGVRLVTIGLDAVTHKSADTLQVAGISEDLLVAAMLSITAGLPEENARAIARECEHSPKLAVLIAQRIKEQPDLLHPQRLLADGALRTALETYLDLEANSSAWRALSTTALLMRLGWTDEVDSESELLFSAVGLNPADARREVDDLHHRYGIAPLAGRFRYVSPALLADHLAARQLGSWPRQKLTDVLTVLTPTMKQYFVLRVRRMSTVLGNRAAVEEVILGDKGPFRTLADLESSEIAALLRHMAAPFPDATLRALWRIIEDSSIEELRDAKKSRRDVVWALEQLLWLEEAFETAAKLLLKLAIAENESWSNNATGLWVETFQTLLGRTAAPPSARARVIESAAVSMDGVARRLAANAIAAALKVEHVHRGGMPSTDVEGIPEQEWRPSTYPEWSDALLKYLKLLMPLLHDHDASVRTAAIHALATGVAAVVQFAYSLFDLWIEQASMLINGEYSEREVILEAIRQMRSRLTLELNTPTPDEGDDVGRLSEDKKFIEGCLRKLDTVENRLLGSDFSSRFRWALFQTSSYSGIDSEEKSEIDAAVELKALTAQALEKPELLDTEWEWLLEQKEWGRVLNWIQLLGDLDKERVFEPVIREKGSNSPVGTMYLSLYYLAHARGLDNPTFVDGRVKDLFTSGACPQQVFDLLVRAGYTPERYDVMFHIFDSGSIPAVYLSHLMYRPWGPSIPPDKALALVTAVKSRAESPHAVIPFVSGYIYQMPDAIPIFKEVAIDLLKALNEKEIGYDPIFKWSRLGLTYVEQAPLEITRAALEQISVLGIYREHDLVRVVERAWEIADKQTLFRDVIAPWLTRTDSTGAWIVQKALQSLPLEQAGAKFLLEWVAVDPESRAVALAGVIGPPVAQDTELHARMLERFGAYGVGRAFFSSYVTGTFVGSFANWTRQKLEGARRWLDDKNPAMREWAKGVVNSLERELKERESQEEEERFRY